VERQRAVIHAKLADPIKVCELMSNIDAWHASLGKARAGWQNAKNLTASNADVSTAELAKRLQLLDDDLHADEADWKIAKKLDDIRMFEEAKAVDGHSKSYTVAPIYEQFFRDLTFDWNVSRPAQIASKIQKSRLRYVLVAALDDWGGKSTDNQVQRLETARLADPDPWRDQVRNRKDWNDLQVLERLARDVDPAVQSPHMLANLARAITRKKGDASSLLRAALIHFPQDFWLHFDLGLATQNADQQIGSFQAALAVRPKSVWTHSNLGIAFAKKRDFDGAIQHYRKALELDPKFGGAYGGLGTALLNKKDVDGAIPHLLKAIELLPNEAELHYNLGNALGVMKDGDGAIRHYRKALDLDPNHIGAHNNLGNGLKGKKDFDGAIRHFRKALDLDANLVPAHVNLGAVLVDKKDVDGAIHHFRKALDMDPNNAAVHSLLGSLLQNKKDIEGAIQHFRNAIELEPNLAKTHFHLAVALQNKKDIDGAIRHLRKGLDLEPSDVKAHNYLVSALKGKKDIEGAIQYLRKALDQNSNFAEAHCNLGSCLLETGQFAEALKHYRLGHELGSKQSGWSYPSAIWVQQGERLVKLDQQVPAVLKGDVQPTSPQEWLAYIDVCRKKKAHASALQLWHKLFLKHPSVEANFRTGLRVNAASDAVLASDGRDKDAAEISDANRTTMRTQAYKWLYADLDAYRKLFQEKQPHAVLAIANTLPELQKTRALATVRDEPNLGKLPEEERKPWQKLWTDVEQLRKQTHGMFKEASRLSGMVTAKETKSVHEMKLKAGTTYVIDLESKAFDTFLRLEDAQGKKLVENDDITPGIDLNSRLIFTPPTDGTYRIIASAFNQSGAGAYTLTIREFVK
jgi:tetratricopeptide (TPR) repeat protein